MAMTKDSFIIPADFVNLKARVKNEMNRRNGNGSLTAYAAAAYDYTTVPAAGTVPLREEHFDKIRDVMATINPALVSLPAKTVGEVVLAMNVLEANMSTFESKPRGEITTSDCSASCTGMCVTICTTACTSCTGCTGCSSCTGGCSGCSGCGSCDSGCYTGCYGCSGCGSGCASGCSGCSGTCTGSCNNTCSGTCGLGDCSAVCASICSGCGSTCWSACYGGGNACSGCTGNCGSGCCGTA